MPTHKTMENAKQVVLAIIKKMNKKRLAKEGN